MNQEAARAAVLVVDDDPSSRGVMAAAVRRGGWSVFEAASGEAAMQALARQGIDLVVTDLTMPGMGGIAFLQRLRGDPATATLPVIAITGDGDGVLRALGAGADDFLAKPVRLDEFQARVAAHLRSRRAWVGVLQADLRERTEVISALGDVHPSDDEHLAASEVVARLARHRDAAFVAVTRIDLDGSMVELATFAPSTGVRLGGDVLRPDLAGYLIARAREGAWVEDPAFDAIEPSRSLRDAAPDLVASAPLTVRGALVGLLTIGARRDPRAGHDQRPRLLAAAVDYAAVMAALAGDSLRDAERLATDRARLLAGLEDAGTRIVLQPIVELESRRPVGYEALTRFGDGTRPDVRFAEAERAGLGATYELASVRLAVEAVHGLSGDLFLSVNVSPSTVMDGADELADVLEPLSRAGVLEITEHVPIDDYAALRAATERFRPAVGLAVDDAGAGFASLRHILELRPAYAKLDISLVRGIDRDPLRRSMAAGLEHYARDVGCHLIAEGVETEGEAATLAGLGLAYAQGFLFA